MATSNNLKREVQKLRLDIDQVTRAKSILSQNQIQKIWNSTPTKYQYQRPAKGGGEWTYIKASYVRKVLDSITGFRWETHRNTTDTQILDFFKAGIKQAIVNIDLILWFRVDGEWISVKKNATGRADIKFRKGTNEPLDLGNDIKAAESDALKKAASRIGVGADVYEPDEFMAIEIEGSDEANERIKNTKNEIKKAKGLIDTEGTAVS